MIAVRARGTAGPGEPFKQITIERRDVGSRDILIDIAYAGICHSDVHHARAGFGMSHFPMVPGHEIAGVVSAIGSEVTRFAVGDRVGVGCMVDSCRECANCRAGLEQYCRVAKVLTYNAVGRDGRVTQGGYSERLVVDERYVVRIPDGIPLERAAPLLCAGITVYSPLRHWGAGSGQRVAIVGFGGLGHVAVQISHALGAHTTVLSISRKQEEDAYRFGADDYRLTPDSQTFVGLTDSFDLIISTVPVSVDVDDYLNLLATNGTLVNLGVPEKPLAVDPYSLFRNRRSLAGSLIGGMAETQEMMDFCAARGIGAVVEVIEADAIDAAYDRVVAGNVRYRFVIDVATI